MSREGSEQVSGSEPLFQGSEPLFTQINLAKIYSFIHPASEVQK